MTLLIFQFPLIPQFEVMGVIGCDPTVPCFPPNCTVSVDPPHPALADHMRAPRAHRNLVSPWTLSPGCITPTNLRICLDELSKTLLPFPPRRG